MVWESYKTKHAGLHDARKGRDPTEGVPAPTVAGFREEAGLLTDAEFERVRELSPVRKPGLGRPRRDDRQVLGGILWVMDTGASWGELPEERFGPNSTAHGRYRKWLKEGIWPRILRALGR